jgi:hypothetical protein
MVAIGEKIVMQTALVTMQGDDRTATARALLIQEAQEHTLLKN